MTHEERAHEAVELAEETIADLTSDADAVGGRVRLTSPCNKTDDDVTCGVDGACNVFPTDACLSERAPAVCS